jgi:hypothetical protein
VCLRGIDTVFDLDTDRAFVRGRDDIEMRLGPVRRRRESERGHHPRGQSRNPTMSVLRPPKYSLTSTEVDIMTLQLLRGGLR